MVATIFFFFFIGATYYFMVQNIANYAVISSVLMMACYLTMEEARTGEIYGLIKALFQIFIQKTLGR